jgi:pSer/pThr/pTyr-binding forkhead associated (FHA) protein
MIRVSLSLSGHQLEKAAFDRPEIFIGRDPSCDLVIDNLGVSRRHARIYQADGEWFVEDLGSQNGIFVDETPVTMHNLLDDDDFSIGKYTVHFEHVRGASPAAVAVERRVAAAATAEAAPAAQALDEYGDHTFALDEGELQKIIGKMRDTGASEEVRSTAPTLTRLVPASPPLSMRLDRSYLLFGKLSSSDIPVQGFWTPRKAALLVQEDGRHFIVSLSGWRKARVNGNKINRHALQDGDVVQVGKSVFRYTTPAG